MAAFSSTTSTGRLLIKLTGGVRAEMTINMSYRPESLILFTWKLEKELRGFKCGQLLISSKHKLRLDWGLFYKGAKRKSALARP